MRLVPAQRPTSIPTPLRLYERRHELFSLGPRQSNPTSDHYAAQAARRHLAMFMYNIGASDLAELGRSSMPIRAGGRHECRAREHIRGIHPGIRDVRTKAPGDRITEVIARGEDGSYAKFPRLVSETFGPAARASESRHRMGLTMPRLNCRSEALPYSKRESLSGVRIQAAHWFTTKLHCRNTFQTLGCPFCGSQQSS